jgi:hypothetical protein
MTGHSGHAQFTVEGHVFSARPLAEGLHLVATPLGNLGDISFRALSTLAAADTILCEDTRVTSRLLQRFAIATRMRPYHDHNAARVRPAILEELRNGVRIVLVSDAGMPAVSDPGYKLVRACIDDGLAGRCHTRAYRTGHSACAVWPADRPVSVCRFPAGQGWPAPLAADRARSSAGHSLYCSKAQHGLPPALLISRT